MRKATLKILTYNIHKASTLLKFNHTLVEIRDLLRSLDCDLIFLQEVVGAHKKLASHGIESQIEYLAESIWGHFSYAKNVVYDQGHHGNVILSKFPIVAWERTDISTNSIEKRGLLHCKIQIAEEGVRKYVHAYCVHLNISQGRREQYKHIFECIRKDLAESDSVILAGDFNDWNRTSAKHLGNTVPFREAFLDKMGRHARTFPARFPLLALDRVYYRNLDLIHCEALEKDEIKTLSDHIPLYCEFAIPADRPLLHNN